jgi:two-component system, chemotaxis family, CheB/CheR fusion protein
MPAAAMAGKRKAASRKLALRRTERELRVARERARALASELAFAEERERQAIARDLHDNLAQLLHVAKLKVAALRKDPDRKAARALLEELDALCTQAETGVRTLVFELNPPVLAELGLAPALQWLAEDLQRTRGLAVEVRDDGAPEPLAQTARSVVYRAVRELLINVYKHAGAGRASVELAKTDAALRLTVRDAGKGFDARVLAGAAVKGTGLVSVRERIGYIGGKVEIRSVPGDGTEVVLTVPLPRVAPA